MKKKKKEQIKENPNKFWSYTQSKLKIKINISNLIVEDGDSSVISLEKDSDKAETPFKFFSAVFIRELTPTDIIRNEKHNIHTSSKNQEIIDQSA